MTDPSDELLDLVSPDNRIIGQKLKLQAHRDGDLHRIVISELINSRGEFCFVKQAPDRQDQGQFVSPVGGHVGAGEEVESALFREAEEEIGLTPAAYRFVGSTIYRRQVIRRDENHLFLVFQIFADTDPILNHESVDFQWFSVSSIRRTLQTSPETFGDAWHHVFRSLFPSIYLI